MKTTFNITLVAVMIATPLISHARTNTSYDIDNSLEVERRIGKNSDTTFCKPYNPRGGSGASYLTVTYKYKASYKKKRNFYIEKLLPKRPLSMTLRTAQGRSGEWKTRTVTMDNYGSASDPYDVDYQCFRILRLRTQPDQIRFVITDISSTFAKP
jgi:hypothetical protein